MCESKVVAGLWRLSLHAKAHSNVFMDPLLVCVSVCEQFYISELDCVSACTECSKWEKACVCM